MRASGVNGCHRFGNIINRSLFLLIFLVLVFSGISCICGPCTNYQCPKVGALILNTGYDQAAGSVYGPVQPDGYWQLVNSPNTSLTVLHPAWVINKGGSWNILPNSNWISAYNTASWSTNNPAPDNPYSFQRCFCTCYGTQSIKIDLDMLVDNVAEVYFDNGLIGSQTGTGTTSFLNPLHISSTINNVTEGVHSIRIDVRNLSAGDMGLDIQGTITSPTGASIFPSDACCTPTGTIQGRKINDLNCNGIIDPGEPALPQWTILAANTATGALKTAVTDASGSYYFTDRTPGTYKVSEQPKSDWTQTMPASPGTYTVTLGAHQVIIKDFANCTASPQTTTCVTIKVVRLQDGAAMANFWVTAEAGQSTTQGTTDANGLVCLIVQKNTTYEVRAGGSIGSSDYGTPTPLTFLSPNTNSGPNDCGNPVRCPLAGTVTVDLIVGEH